MLLKNVGVTSFDTRFSAKDKGTGIRILLESFGGYPAGRITESLKGKVGLSSSGAGALHSRSIMKDRLRKGRLQAGCHVG